MAHTDNTNSSTGMCGDCRYWFDKHNGGEGICLKALPAGMVTTDTTRCMILSISADKHLFNPKPTLTPKNDDARD